MKRLLVPVLILNASVLGLRAWQEGLPTSGAETRETRVSGDVNCDSHLDLADAIFTLNHLFVGTIHPPCPLADRPELLSEVVRLEADLEECGSSREEHALSLAACRKGLLGEEADPLQRFIDQGEVFTDRSTGLMWMHDIGGGGWHEAKAYCEALDFAGYSDWRLPTIHELFSLRHYEPFPVSLEGFLSGEGWSCDPECAGNPARLCLALSHWSSTLRDGRSLMFLGSFRTAVVAVPLEEGALVQPVRGPDPLP